MIEAATKTTNKFDAFQAELYIWTCTHNDKYDWRFPTFNDTVELAISGSWTANDYEHYDFIQLVTTNYHWKVTPVRDKDD